MCRRWSGHGDDHRKNWLSNSGKTSSGETTIFSDSETPGLEELISLYDAVEWTAYTREPCALSKAVASSDHVVTARSDGRLIGLIRSLSDDVSIVYIQDLLVHPRYQRRGIGKSLIDACLERYGHVRKVVLMTDSDERVHSFYQAAGFRALPSTEVGLHGYVKIGIGKPEG